MNSSQFKPFK